MIADARIARVHRAVLFIEPRLFSPLPLADVAHAAGGSLYHLHRLFTEVYGVSLARYIRCRRLSEAARMLRSTPMGVLDIAIRCRYGSQATFTRAFRRQFGAPPAAFRRGAGRPWAGVGPATVLELQHRSRLERAPRLVWRHDDRRLIGLVGQANPDVLEDFTALQEALVAQVGESHEAVGIAGSVDAEGTMAFFLGVDAEGVGDVPAGASLVEDALSAGLYAVFRHRGGPDEVRTSIAFFAQAWDRGPSMASGTRPDAEVFCLADRSAPRLDVALWIAVDAAS